MNIVADVKKHFELADEKYQQSKKNLEDETIIFTDKFESLQKEFESLKAGNLMLSENLELKILSPFFGFQIHFLCKFDGN